MGKAFHFGAQPAVTPEIGGPKPDRLVAGNPRHTTYITYESADGRTFCGVWESTEGAWRVVYDEWESCTVLDGRCTVTPDGGEPIHLGPGDTLVMEPGFSGLWTVTTAMRKTFVVRV
jgi:uncharacterized cupin superfamily protein